MFNTLTFPETIEEFIEQYKVVKGENLYCDGVEFIPVFRMKEWFERSQSQKGETVDKQAAIDAINDVLSHYTPFFRDDQEGIPLECARAIRDLPSVQPETCEGCKHLDKWENEVEYGYSSPCTSCKRRVEDYYER